MNEVIGINLFVTVGRSDFIYRTRRFPIPKLPISARSLSRGDLILGFVSRLEELVGPPFLPHREAFFL